MKTFLRRVMTFVLLTFLAAPLTASAQDASGSSSTKTPRHALPLLQDKIPEQYRSYFPLPFGISFVYVHQVMPLLLENPVFQITGMPLPPGLVQSASIKAVTNSETARLDTWILPFLNVYGTVTHFSGDGNDLQVSLAAPVPIAIPQQVSYSGSGYGVGMTVAFGYRAFFASYDANWNWPKPDVINRIRVLTQGPRAGVQLGPWGVRGKLYGGAIGLTIAGPVEGSITLPGGASLAFEVQARPEKAWSPLAGAEFEVHRHVTVSAEGAFARTKQVLLSAGYRF